MFTKTPTEASQIRFTYAQEIAASCPDSLFSEIALTGSSARGIANEHSDLEINLWIAEIPPIAERRNWLISLGVEDIIVHPELRPDGSIWINARYKGIELEIGWQTFADLATSLNELLEAQTTEHKKLRLAELVLSAKSLRGTDTLNHWQTILQNYPQALADKLIADALSQWLNDHNWLENRIQNDDFTGDIAAVYRILFALNHRWEINWKWAYHILPELKILPQSLNEFIGEHHHALPIFDLNTLIVTILETLSLIDASFSKRDATLARFQHIQNKSATIP